MCENALKPLNLGKPHLELLIRVVHFLVGTKVMLYFLYVGFERSLQNVLYVKLH